MCNPVLRCPVHRHRTQSGVRDLAVVPTSPVLRHSSDPQLSPGSNNNLPDMLAASSHSTPAHCSYETPADGSETGGSYCDLLPTPALCPKAPCAAGMPPTPPTKSYVERLRVEEGRGPAPGRENGAGAGGEAFSAPLVETASSFRPGKYLSPLIPQENKPLEMSVLKRVKELLAEVDARTAAKHITMADCKVWGHVHTVWTHRTLNRVIRAVFWHCVPWTPERNSVMSLIPYGQPHYSVTKCCSINSC